MQDSLMKINRNYLLIICYSMKGLYKLPGKELEQKRINFQSFYAHLNLRKCENDEKIYIFFLKKF